jgi:hypothetical protein
MLSSWQLSELPRQFGMHSSSTKHTNAIFNTCTVIQARVGVYTLKDVSNTQQSGTVSFHYTSWSQSIYILDTLKDTLEDVSNTQQSGTILFH